MPPRIFISYRRDDAAGDAGRLTDHLRRRFGATQVFLDIDTINPGTDFVRVLRASLEQTAAMLVVIGSRWTSLRGADGTRRLDDPNDFVRLEVEAALGRSIPVVPVLVQGATLPRKEELPASLAPLTTRQVAVLDHAEFHDDVERLCDQLAMLIGVDKATLWSRLRRWWPAAALVAVLALGFVGYRVMYSTGETTAAVSTAEDAPTRRVEALLGEASAQHRRDQFVESLATLARAREVAPASETVRRMQEDVAMDWIRSARVESGKSSFGEVIKPAIAVIDASLPTATGQRRADLLAHSGWAAFLMWRDGNRRLNPAEWYRDALSLDPGNPYANAMLAHWVLLREGDVPHAVKLFDAALQQGRAIEAVRILQWGAYNNSRTPEGDAERVRLADAMRQGGERLNMEQAQALWGPYYLAMPISREKVRQLLLEALAPDDHISTLGWAFEEYAAKDESRRRTIRYYVALLHASAGRVDRAAADLQTLEKELDQNPGSLSDAVQGALGRLQSGARGRSLR